MTIKLTVSTRVNLPAGTEVEVSEQEAKRLLLLGYAEASGTVETADVTPQPKRKTATRKK